MCERQRKGLVGLPARRKAAGFTQETFAEELGATRSALAAWETGAAWPSAAILPAIADLLLCTIDDLYKEPGPEAPPISEYTPSEEDTPCRTTTSTSTETQDRLPV